MNLRFFERVAAVDRGASIIKIVDGAMSRRLEGEDHG